MKRRLVYTEDTENKVYRGERTFDYTTARVQRITTRKYKISLTCDICLHVFMLVVLLPLKSNCGPNYGSYDLLQTKPRTNFRSVTPNLVIVESCGSCIKSNVIPRPDGRPKP
jgi:hypothetical protein